MKSIAKALPNQDLIRHLVSTYYRDSPSSQESAFISSHWKHYSSLFNCEVDGDGNLISLSGVGFGTCKWGGLLHRVLDSACTFSHLVHLSSRKSILQLMPIATRLCSSMGLNLTFDVFRQVCVLSFLKGKIPATIYNKHISILVIGDGFGMLSSLLKAVFPNSTIVMVDIGKVLMFQAYYCQKAHPKCIHRLAGTFGESAQSDFIYCPAEHLDSLDDLVFDLAVNVASMQEMNMLTITKYFAFLRSHLHEVNLFYCCNREFKKMPGGEVTEFDKYPWKNEDWYLVDGYCPWHQYFFSSTKAVNGLWLLGIEIPFVNFYASKIRHRLAILSLESSASP